MASYAGRTLKNDRGPLLETANKCPMLAPLEMSRIWLLAIGSF